MDFASVFHTLIVHVYDQHVDRMDYWCSLDECACAIKKREDFLEFCMCRSILRFLLQCTAELG